MKYIAALILLILPAPVLAAGAGDVFIAVNRERAFAHEAPLRWNVLLQAAAQAAADDLARTETFTHERAWSYLDETGYKREYAGQNLARRFPAPILTAAVQGWMSSPTHRANVLFPQFKDIGVATARAKNGEIYLVAYFGTPLTAPADVLR